LAHQLQRFAAIAGRDNLPENVTHIMPRGASPAPAAESGRTAFTFGDFRLLATERQLLLSGRPVSLGSRALDLLFDLVENAGELVGKEALIARAWPDTHVEEATLRVHIAALRRALGDGRDGARYIQNEPGRGYRFVAPVLHDIAERRAAPPTPAEERRPVSPPPMSLSRIIGRAATVAALAAQMESRRFLSLVGPGGIGKTTVAIAVADRLAADYRHGVCFVDLTPVSDPRLLPFAVATALGLPAGEGTCPRLLAFLKDRRMLIVLDNCEHLIEASAYAAEMMLRSTPNIHVLATSREPLRAEGEWVHRLAALGTPDDGAVLTATEALAFPALELFVERASARSGYQLADADVGGIVRLCHRLDGIPLAIELAAARIGVFGACELIAGLEDRLEFFSQGCRTAPPRQQTLRATLDWSYGLLSAAQQTVLARLSVCAGRMDIETTIAVASDRDLAPGDVIDALAELVAKSLIAVHAEAGCTLYRLLDTTRAYARGKLDASDDGHATRRRHAQHVHDWLGEAPQAPDPGAMPAGAGALGIDDMRAALRWCFGPDGDVMLGLSLAARSVFLCFQLTSLDECRSWCERALAALETMPSAAGSLAAQLHAAFGDALLNSQGASPEAAAAFARAVAIADRLHTHALSQRLAWSQGVERILAGDFEGALVLARSFEARCREIGEERDIQQHRLLAAAYHFHGDQRSAMRHAEAVVATPPDTLAAACQGTFQFCEPYSVLARIYWVAGRPGAATEAAQRGLDRATATARGLPLCYALATAAIIALWNGRPDFARKHSNVLQQNAEQHSLIFWQTVSRCLQLAADVRESKTGPEDVRALLNDPRWDYRGCAFLYTLSDEIAVIDRAALPAPDAEPTCWRTAELMRLRAIALTRQRGADAAAEAEALLARAIDLARAQGALAWELRAATALARLWSRHGRTQQARDLLLPARARFVDGFATADLGDAESLLRTLPEAV
jgi:predicted ATPase/DNA-binding winged helix-turn-helix (wHTH) protein